MKEKTHVSMQVFRLPLTKALGQYNYHDFLASQTILEKRKFVCLLLAVYTDASPNEIAQMTIGDLRGLLNNHVVRLEEKKIHLTDEGYELFTDELYSGLTIGRKEKEKLLVSIIERKPLSTINLKRDCNEQLVKILANDYSKKGI